MKNKDTFKRISAATGFGAAVVAATLGVTAAPASAATSNHFTLCATGNYTAYAVFTDRGNFSSTLVPAGRCWTGELSGRSVEHVAVYGNYNNNPSVHFKVGSFYYSDAAGAGADAAGTTTAPVLQRW